MKNTKPFHKILAKVMWQYTGAYAMMCVVALLVQYKHLIG